MSEDWRVTARFPDPGQAHRAVRALSRHEVADRERERLGGQVAVTSSDNDVFCYAVSERAAEGIAQIVAETLAREGLEPEIELHCWNHSAEAWEDASEPGSEDGPKVSGEPAEDQADNTADWELRIEFASHHDARAFEQRLAQEGFSHLVRRWRFLLVGTEDEDDARRWAERLRGELPPGATIQVEPGGGVVQRMMPANPFALFGGLGG